MLDPGAKKRIPAIAWDSRNLPSKDRFMPDLASLLPIFFTVFSKKFQSTVTGYLYNLSIRSGVRIMSNYLSSHPLLNPLTLNFNTRIEMMAVDDIGVGAHLVMTACEQSHRQRCHPKPAAGPTRPRQDTC